MSFKLQIVQEIEQGKTSIFQTRKQYGIQNHAAVFGWLKKFGHFQNKISVTILFNVNPNNQKYNYLDVIFAMFCINKSDKYLCLNIKNIN